MTKELSLPNGVSILSGSANPDLTKGIGKIFGIDIPDVTSGFGDSERDVKIPENVRKRHVIIVQPTCPPDVNKNIIELLLIIDAAKRASAAEITAIIPYFGYSRKDRKDRARVPISSAAIAKSIKATGADRILTIDLHAEQEEGFFDGPWDNLFASYSLIPEIKKENLRNIVTVSPDKNGVARATAYARLLDSELLAIILKQRDTEIHNETRILTMIGEVNGHDALVVDDIGAAGDTIFNSGDLLEKRGAKRILAAVTHGLFLNKKDQKPALEKLSDSPIEKVFITDTVYIRPELAEHPKIKVVTVAPLIAEAIQRIGVGSSLSELIS